MSKTVAMLGEGAWGTAVSTILAQNGYQVKLWCYDSEIAKQIITTRINSDYAPDILLSSNIIPVTDIEEAVSGADLIFEAVPTMHIRSILKSVKSCILSEQPWVILSKGIEQGTFLLPSQILSDETGLRLSYVVVSGPSFAYDVLRKQPTSLVVASHDQKLAFYVKSFLETDFIFPEISCDPIGVQLVGAYKNCIALAVGIIDGLKYTDNTKALVVTRGIKELADLIDVMGGDRSVILSAAGFGDIFLTCFGQHSKNLRAGRYLAQGKTIDEIESIFGVIPEGINTVYSMKKLGGSKNMKMPLCHMIYEILLANDDPKLVVERFFKAFG
ncbi:MAG TPA: NAD(P)H-dependent glycerol-3-phosphate dehydrogenase [Candidatus Babeliales bacterium]|nr:NAD(P)H-dependent glycerol-3-phosphate dehydrogenase [Candidatus Babeliales bacterium]